MIRIIKDSVWKPADNIIYNDGSSESGVVKSDKNCLVSAGPGAGKTELLAQKALFLLQTNKCSYPRKILALSFKVDAANNIKKRVEARCGQDLSNRFVSNTYDSFFKSLLDRFLNLIPEEYRPSQQYNIISSKDMTGMIKAYKYAGVDFKSLYKKSKDFYKMFYLTENSLPIGDDEYFEIAKKVWPILLKGTKEIEPQISFKMVARLVEYIIKENPMIKKSLELTYSHIFLDEFQDTTKEQYAVVKACFKDTSTIVTAVGDKKQRIMKWAGAVPEIFEKFKLDFNAEEKTLLVNHRSAPRLIKLQNKIVEEILGSKLDVEPDQKWSENNGICEMWHFKNEDDEAEFLSKKIDMLIKEEMIDKNSICILTRNLTDEYSNKLIDKLSEINIEARVENFYQDLLREEMVNIILSIIKLSVVKLSPDDWLFIVNLFKNIKGYSSYTKSEKINSLEKNISMYLDKLSEFLYKVTTKEELEKTINNIINYLGVMNIKYLYPQYKKGNYFESTIKKFVDLFWEDYSVDRNWKNSIERFKGEYTIPIMSIHKSKGLEFDVIILLGVEGSAFFGIKDNLNEELCNFFVAVSRAKEKLFFTYSDERIIKGKKKLGQKNSVKLFYDLMEQSDVVESYNFTDDFKKQYLYYYNATKDMIAAEESNE